MGSKSGLVALILIVAAMLVGTKFYTDSRFQASQDALASDVAYCRTLRESGGASSPSDRERCDTMWSRDGARNRADETVAMALLGVTALVALIGVVLILRGRRRATTAPDAG